MTTLTGTIEKTIFRADDTGWSVLFVNSNGSGCVTCVGNLLESAYEGLDFEFVGDWANDPKYGRQFKFISYQAVRPSTAKGIERYLASGILDGIGPALAARIVARFGETALDVLDNEPERLETVAGIGKKKLAAIREQWEAQSRYREAVVWLLSLGITMSLAVKVIKHFVHAQRDPQEAVQSNPYCLTELWGVGFLKADAIARRLGFAVDHPARLRAGLVYMLQQARDGYGHCYLPRHKAIEATAELCGVDGSLVEALEEDLANLSAITVDGGDAYYLPRMHFEETDLAKRLSALAETRSRKLRWMDRERLQAAFRAEVGYQLTQEQIGAVYAVLGANLAVLTGGPGVGKSSAVRAMVMLIEAANLRVELTSPTGRAAKRLEELSKHGARTIHRLLGWSQEKHCFTHDAGTPLETDFVIVDEASMVDVGLAQALVSAIDPKFTQLLLVGDKDQLPSVGPGSVLNDIIRSGRVPVCELTQIMRQAEGSGIILDAHNVNEGRLPALNTPECTWWQADDADRIRKEIMRVALDYRGTDLQILTPMRKGPVGTFALNRMLQEALNPAGLDKPQMKRGMGDTEVVYRLGDRVIQTRNDYDRGVMNGDIGQVADVNPKDRELSIEFSDTVATYGPDDLRNVDLAYALTIHKAQGSEYDTVVIVACWAHWVMLQRNLLYTALSRARERAVVIGEWRAIERAVSNNKPSKRHTRLRERLKE